MKLVHLLREDERGGELLYESVESPEVMALFVSHGIIRSDRTIDVLRVVEQIRAIALALPEAILAGSALILLLSIAIPATWNVDTDAIIPKQFLKSIKKTGFGPNLFDEWRYLDHGEPGQDPASRKPNPD